MNVYIKGIAGETHTTNTVHLRLTACGKERIKPTDPGTHKIVIAQNQLPNHIYRIPLTVVDTWFLYYATAESDEWCLQEKKYSLWTNNTHVYFEPSKVYIENGMLNIPNNELLKS